MHLLLIIVSLRLKLSLCAIGDVANAKCLEYGNYVYEQNSEGIDVEAPSNCGISEVPLVVGGEEANEMEFPHMAILGFASTKDEDVTYNYNCGGTLISEFFILTAAHCMQQRAIGPCQVVKLGVVLLSDPDAVIKMVKERIPHPEFKPPSKHNDIALLRLDSKVKFDPFIRPACVRVQKIEQEKTAIASGWGKTAYENEEGSSVLMKVTLDIISNDICSKLFENHRLLPRGIDESLMCAGKLEGGKDTCQGDSGGPLSVVLKEPYCMYNILGVVSFGKYCGFANSPGVYSRVSYFIDWIEGIVWSNSSQ